MSTIGPATIARFQVSASLASSTRPLVSDVSIHTLTFLFCMNIRVKYDADFLYPISPVSYYTSFDFYEEKLRALGLSLSIRIL